MTVEGIVSILTVVASLATKVVGAPSQMRALLRTKDSRSFSVLNNTLIVVAYLLWSMHGVFRKDWTVIIAQGIGLVTSSIVLFLVLRYRHGANE